jgi:hypothetical protein
MRKLLFASAIMLTFGIAASPAMALGKCHGEEASNGWWDLKFQTWSMKESAEVVELVKILDNVDPGYKHDLVAAAKAVDRLQCNGFEHDEAFKAVIEQARKQAQH